MGLADVDAPGFDVEAGGGEEGVMLFRRFSIAASMLSRSAMSKKRESAGLELKRDFIYDSKGPPRLCWTGRVWIGSQSESSRRGR